jgi:S-DNA-T family DNA segregation ATPase FtsK/SpoIIIE
VQRLFEACIIAIFASAIFLAIALISFYPSDPSWSQTAWQGVVGNYAGCFGAWLADILFFAFGFVAYASPFILAGVGYLIFWRPSPLRQVNFFTVGLRLLGFVIAFTSATALASANIDDFYYFSSGGLVGDIFASAVFEVFGLLGGTIMLLALFGCGITLFTGVSWVSVVEVLGGGINRAVNEVIQFGHSRRHRKDDDTQDVSHEDPVYDPLLDDERASDISIRSPFDDTPAASYHSETMDERRSAISYSELVEPSLGSAEVESDDEALLPWLSEPQDELDSALPKATNDQIDAMERVADTPSGAETQKGARFVAPAGSLTLAELQAQHQKPKPVDMPPLPDISLLDRPDKKHNPIPQEVLDQVARLVEAKLLDFNVQANVVAVHPGPVITRFELDLAPGVKVSKISGLSKDLARSLSATSVRVVEVIPGKSVIGLELPNQHREIVYLRDVINTPKFYDNASALTMVLGKDIAGDPVVVDLAKMPHLLVAGTTGSGKSVGVNVMILSLLYKSTPEDVRLIMIDPKMLELSVYEGIPHLLSEVVTDMKEAANALRWCVGEMERRYKLMSALGVRNLKGFNAKVKQAKAAGQPIGDPLWKPGDSMDETAPLLDKLPAIVVIVDEFADMMMIVGKKVEELIARIAQKARAAGIHLILATQRPSVDVITGLIKANIPTRIAFQVSSKIDSRTILDQQGAEALLGQGDMLYLPPGTGVPTRVHGAFVDDHEVHRVVADWKLRGEPNYIDEILNGDTSADTLLPGEVSESDADIDALFDQAVAFVTESRRGSVSGVQRKFKIGYNRAARIVEQMEAHGIVSPPGHNGNREVLAPPPVRID